MSVLNYEPPLQYRGNGGLDIDIGYKGIVNDGNIKKNIEKLFKVNVVKINIINQKTKIKMKQGKKSYKSGYKKAIITLKKGQSIDLTTGI